MVEELADDPPDRQVYLVVHDYGLGALWWWVRASSPEEIAAEFAEVEVISAPDRIALARTWNLKEVDIEYAKRRELADLHEQRRRQREDPAFGRLFGKARVYLRLPDEEGEGTQWLFELGPDGRRLRQIERLANGTSLTTDLTNWPLNPPFDLGDPWLAAHEISKAEFEQVWEQGPPALDT